MRKPTHLSSSKSKIHWNTISFFRFFHTFSKNFFFTKIFIQCQVLLEKLKMQDGLKHFLYFSFFWNFILFRFYFVIFIFSFFPLFLHSHLFYFILFFLFYFKFYFLFLSTLDLIVTVWKYSVKKMFLSGSWTFSLIDVCIPCCFLLCELHTQETLNTPDSVYIFYTRLQPSEISQIVKRGCSQFITEDYCPPKTSAALIGRNSRGLGDVIQKGKSFRA